MSIMLESKPSRLIVLFLIILFLISIIALAVLYYQGLLRDKDAFEREIGETLLQVIAVAVLGTIASLLLAEFNRKQEALR